MVQQRRFDLGMTDKHIHVTSRLSKIIRQHPFEWVTTIRTLLTTLKYRFVFPCTAKGCIVGFNTQIINFTRVNICKYAFLQDHVYLRAGMDGFITIGEGVAINSFAKIFGHGGVTVGNNAQIGPGALLTTTSHDMENKMQTSFHPIRIGDWSWIGANATVLPGITIGEHCIIGAGSMVTKDIPSYSVAVGSPAKVIKKISMKHS